MPQKIRPSSPTVNLEDLLRFKLEDSPRLRRLNREIAAASQALAALGGAR